MEITAFWDMPPYRLIGIYQRFGGSTDSMFRLDHSSALKLEVAGSFETLVNIYILFGVIPRNVVMFSHLREDLTFHMPSSNGSLLLPIKP
jgi:hypothetical protein